MSEKLYVSEVVDAAKELAIKEVHDCTLGCIRAAEELLPRDSESLHARRRQIQKALVDGLPLYRCAYCARPIYLSLGGFGRLKGLHFRHFKEDGECVARTRTGKTQRQIEALKYDGLKEGALHRETKELLVASLKADPQFSAIEVETRVTSKDGTEWRQPDVRALYGQQRVAFEIQLATTFLSVIEARSRFYLQEGIRLVWVFRSFDTENRAAAIDDIYFGNNRNALVISPETRNVSVGAGMLLLRCHWPQPELRGSDIVEIWKDKLVPFASLKTDAFGREYFYDCDTERANLRLPQFKQQVRAYCVTHDDIPSDVREARWFELVSSAESLGFDLTGKGIEVRFRKLMSALFSLEEGKPVGFGFRVLINIAHHLYDKHGPLLFYFMHAENAFRRRDELQRAGRPGVWEQRRKDAKAKMGLTGECKPDKRHDPIVRAFFPEVGAEIERSKQSRLRAAALPNAE